MPMNDSNKKPLKTSYKSDYDPLYDKIPGYGDSYVPSYWVSSAGPSPADDGAINSDIEVDVAIIGGGFTGLATAMFLAKEYHIKATVLEANQVAWGCTSRNGGQGHLAWGRLSRSQWARKWGVAMAKKIHLNTLAGFEIFKTLAHTIDCEPCGDGNLLIAHSASAMKKLKNESDFCNQILGYQTKTISTSELHQNYIRDHEAHGALIEPVGIALHPLKLAFGYMKIAREYGASVHPASPVMHWQTINNKHHLTTPGGVVKATTVVVATAGYTHKSLHPLLAYKNMPIMANSAVTSMLSDAQISESGLRTNLLMTDTRKLRYYYRLLPDKRLQIGTRSAISGADNDNPRHLDIIKNAIRQKFPALQDITIDYFWSGWMDISHDMMPRVVKPDPKQTIYYAQGYSGNGVSFSAYAAKKLADLVAGAPSQDKDLPIFSSPLPSHPLRILRRPGQRLMFRYFNFLDKLP